MLFRSLGSLASQRDRLFDEIERVIVGRCLSSEAEYLNANRDGRGFSLGMDARRAVWAAHVRLVALLAEHRRARWCDIVRMAAERLAVDAEFVPYRAVVVDEGQDFTPAMLRLARQLAGGKGHLTVFVDPDQDIYDSGFRWTRDVFDGKNVTVRWLNRNYRNSAPIAALAASLLGDAIDTRERPPKGIEEALRPGPLPTLIAAADATEEINVTCEMIADEVKKRPANQVAIICPTREGLEPFDRRLRLLGIPTERSVDTRRLCLTEESVKLVTVHSAKGLDFPTIFVVRLTEEAFRHVAGEQSRPSRRQLYVALTRASDRLVLSTVQGKHCRLLEALDPALMEVVGSRAREFLNLRGLSN